MEVRTVEHDRNVLLDQGLTDGPTLELFVRSKGPERHASRVAYARATLLAASHCAMGGRGIVDDTAIAMRIEHCAEGIYTPTPEVAALAWAIADAEMFGVGGGVIPTGLSTRRVPCLTGLGKGRSQATDGPAWSAAITEAANDLCCACRDALGVVPAWQPTPDGLAVAGGTPEQRDVGKELDIDAATIAAVIPLEWRQSVALQTLRELLETRRPYFTKTNPTPEEVAATVAHRANISAWAALCDLLLEEVEPGGGGSEPVVEADVVDHTEDGQPLYRATIVDEPVVIAEAVEPAPDDWAAESLGAR